MNERHTNQNSRQNDFETGHPVQNHLRLESRLLLAGTSSFPHSVGDVQHHNLLDYGDGTAGYGMAQYAELHPLANCELGVPSGSCFYNLHLNPPDYQMFPVHVNTVSIDQFPTYRNYRGNAIPVVDYARNNLSLDGLGGSYKRKNAEAISGNVQYSNIPSRPSSSVSGLPLDSCVSMMDASYAVTEYRGNSPLPVAQDHGRNRAVVAGLHRFSSQTYNYNHTAQGNFMGQPFQPSSGTWMNQQSINNSVGGGAVPWNVIPIIPCFPGSNIRGASFETAIVHPHGYHEAAGHRSHGSFLHSASMINQPHNLHPLPCIQGIGGFPVACQPLAAGTGGGHPLNNDIQRTFLSLSSIDVEGLPPMSGFRMNHPNRRGGLPDAVSRHLNVPCLNLLPADEVAILEIPSVYEAVSAIDHHSDMRLDIDGMSYEDLLALGEQIGNVNTGLSERAIAEHLRTRLHNSFSASINLEELPSADQKVDFCIICQSVGIWWTPYELWTCGVSFICYQGAETSHAVTEDPWGKCIGHIREGEVVPRISPGNER